MSNPTPLLTRLADVAERTWRNVSASRDYVHTWDRVRTALLAVLGDATSEELLWTSANAARLAEEEWDRTPIEQRPTDTRWSFMVRAASALLIAPWVRQVQQLQAESERASQAYADRDMEAMTLTGELAALRAENARLRDEVEAQRLRFAAAEESVAGCAQRVTTLRQQLDAAVRERETLREALAGVTDARPCEMHAGGRYCMVHNEKTKPGGCPHWVAQELLDYAAAAPTTEGRIPGSTCKCMDWQPIETAPKDGTDVLLGWFLEYGGGGSPEVAFWHGFRNQWCGRVLLNAEGYFSPTHWMPLPAPPAAPTEPGEGAP